MTVLRYFFLITSALLSQIVHAEKMHLDRLDAPQNEPIKLALLIHIYNFEYKTLPDLATKESLPLMKNSLKAQGFKDENITVLPNETATSANVRDTFNRFIATKVKGKTGAVVTILLDSHGIEVPDWSGDEKPLNPADESDEAFVCRDYTDIENSKNPHPKGYLLDDELGTYYERILSEIGPEGHLVVFMAGCHSTTQMKGNSEPGPSIPILDFVQAPRNTSFGKFIYFASVANDAAEVKPYYTKNEGSSYLVHGVSEAIRNLTPKSTYQDLLVDAQRVIDRDRLASDYGVDMAQLNIPIQIHKHRLEKAFRGYTNTSPLLKVITNTNAFFIEKLSDKLKEAFDIKKGGPDQSQMVVIEGGLAGGLVRNSVVEFTDEAENFLVSGTIVELDQTNAVVRLDHPVTIPVLKVRRPAPTLTIHATATVPAQTVDLLANYVSITPLPNDAPLTVSFRNGSYELCASGLPFTATGCASFATEKLLLAKIRSLALYQALKYKHRKSGGIKAVYNVRHGGVASVNETIDIPGNIHADNTTDIAIHIRLEATETQKRYYQVVDVSPDQPLNANSLIAEGHLGRTLSVQIPASGEDPLACCTLSPSGEKRIDLSNFQPPYGLEENMLVYSLIPIDLRPILEGKQPITAELINMIEYVEAGSYQILPDRKQRKK